MGFLLRGEILQEKEWSKEGVVDMSSELSDVEDISAYGNEDPMDMSDASEGLDLELIAL